MNKVILPIGKAALDAMTKKEIDAFRLKYLQQSRVPEIESRRYFKEIELYCKIRFKDDEFAKYERWSNEAANPKSIDPQYREGTVFTMGIINKMGREEFYKLSIEQTEKELGEMQYVK